MGTSQLRVSRAALTRLAGRLQPLRLGGHVPLGGLVGLLGHDLDIAALQALEDPRLAVLPELIVLQQQAQLLPVEVLGDVLAEHSPLGIVVGVALETALHDRVRPLDQAAGYPHVRDAVLL
jgi:hypothetical protein